MISYRPYCRRRAFITMMLAFMSAAANAADRAASTPPMLNLTAGDVGLFDDIEGPRRYGIEYRMRPRVNWWNLSLAFGYAQAKNGARFVYADLRRDFWLSDRWVLIPSFGVGSFRDSDQIRLGKELEFRSGLELAYRLHGEYRLGAAIFHLSNGGLGESNPGTEALVVSLCIPLQW